MTTLLIILAVVAAVYIYAAVVQYYGFKNWYPMCGCKGKPALRRKSRSFETRARFVTG